MARKLGSRPSAQLPQAGQRQLHMSSPSRRSFGVPNALGIQDDGEIADIHDLRRPSRRASWMRSNILSVLTNQEEELGVKSPTSERPPIPSALHAREPDSTPLPVLSMIVLSITMLGEFLSANVSMPFLLFMVKGFNEFQEESDIAFYTGILVAAFFLTQFLTSLLWATVADRHGRRTVLFLSLFGSAVTVSIFGTCTSFRQALVVRLLQGIFAGAVGVARGCVATVTDATNEGRAYAIMGFCWGFGGVAGAIVGGAFERPAEKWPEALGHIPFFIDYPYFLPCVVAGSITLIGSFLSLLLGRDGGPKDGAIRLPPEKPGNQPSPIPEEDEILNEPIEDERPTGLFGALKRKFSRSILYISTTPSVPLISSPSIDRQRLSRANGSAYGYGDNQRHRIASTIRPHKSVASTLRSGRSTYVDGHQPSYEGSELNFTQRLLMANENAVTNIADLWVAAAMNVDNEDQYDLDADMPTDEEQVRFGGEGVDEQDVSGTVRGRQNLRSIDSVTISSQPRPRSSMSRLASARGVPLSRTSTWGSPFPGGTRLSRRSSTTGPSIFAHAGVRTPPAVLDAQLREAEPLDALMPILEHRGPVHAMGGTEAGGAQEMAEKPPSLASQLPILVIIQYGLLALHSTTHDQVFLSYLVTDFGSGGLNLNPGHFSQLIALMCLFQIVYQFYLYPNIGPPRGRFSHMAMFRLGSILFIPAYLTVILFRVFASATDDGNFFLMAALSLSTAVRYCGNTFAYTAVSILLNYMTPPAAVGFANGAAQSIVSLARCLGPILGGYLWAASTQDDPSGYPLGFLACAATCALAVAHSFLIR
ncbi:hypothetical protein L210DRAFT_3761196 [Boletus edulis BED1]|uniref:Major facilitator superfamily MFS-1 n=1 Tax=Boletus edulis BED1 TaxID=1328754 RepID=A0AAD4BSW1_BOLED|nr:hypothetical protein L210DRAFT_3761196 [Boletus edulis BED1]